MVTINDFSPEIREDIPLKTGTRTSSCCTEDCLGGSKFINFAFGTLTVVITIALVVQIHYGDYQVIPHGSVATDNINCSKIGTTILKENGNAVDAAIASAFCLSVTNPHVTGLDAEGQILLYNHRTRFMPKVVDFTGTNIVSENVPRLVLGLAYIHQEFGSMEWRRLVQPSVDLAKNGFLVSKTLVQAINTGKKEGLFGKLEVGQSFQMEKLANTLSKIAEIPESELYSYIKLTNRPIQMQAVKIPFKNYDVYVPNAISGVLLTALRKIDQINYTNTNADFLYQMAESVRTTQSELNFTMNEGTSSNIAVMDLHDNYVSFVVGMNSLFGSGEITSAGYILDNQSADRPSTRLPIILTDAKVICGKRLIFGTNDLSLAVQLITSLVVEKQNATETIEAARFHVLSDGTFGLESFPSQVFSDEIIKKLNRFVQPVLIEQPYSSSNIIEKLKDDISSHSDSRGGGIASRF